MNILVTGGSGFIGSRLVDLLFRQGHNVTVLDYHMSPYLLQMITSAQNFNNRLNYMPGSITDAPKCREACEGQNVVYHLAALKSVPESIEIPLQYNNVNINGTVNMLEAAKNAKVNRFVFASSSAIYGNQETHLPIMETLKPRPSSPYAVTKLAGESYCRAYSYTHGLRTVALRFFNVYGPGQAPNDPYAGVISKFIDSILKGERPKIFGDGKQTRDFVYVDDVVLALAHTINPAFRLNNFEEFNIGSGRGNSLLQTLDIIKKQLGSNIEPEFLPPQEGDIRTSVAEIHKAEMYLGYGPEIKFTDGLFNTIKHHEGYEVYRDNR